MAIEFKEIIMHIRKGVTSSIRISYRSVRAHPYISGLLFLLLLLYRAFPVVFAFLISYSPVIISTAILLGTLLSYGTPNIPEIEEEIKKAQEISSLQMGSPVDDVILKKDEKFTVETHLENDLVVSERATEKAVGEASYSSNNEIEKEENSESIDNKAELAVELDSNIHNVPINDQKELDGLRVQIAKPLSDSLFDSALGSPWQTVEKNDASSNSDSDGDESSSPDASLADIIPMLDELHPLLDSELPQPTIRAHDDSDSSSSSSASFQDHESDDEVKNEEAKEKDEKNEEVPWTEDDQKNVMDLGYSEEERNRRLENLIAKRRLRKLQSQRYEIERNLIDFDSFYPSPIPPISAPRRNPFDILYTSDSNLPGSAPSILQPRQNPFDLPHDQVDEITTLSKDFLNHNDFLSAAQRERLSRFHERSIGGPSFLGDSSGENNGSKLNPFFVAERSELIHPEIQQESPTMSPISIDFKTTDMEETHQDASNLTEEIGKGEDNLPACETGKLEMIEEKYDDSDSSLSEEKEKISEAHIHETSADLEKENPVYDSDQSKIGQRQTDILTLDEALLHEGGENTIFNPLPSDEQEDLLEVASPPRSLQANDLLEDRDLSVVKTREEDSVESSGLSMVKEDESKLREIPGIKEHDAMQVGISEISGNEEAGKIMQSSSSSSVDTESSKDHLVNVDRSIQSEGNDMINGPVKEESVIRPSPEAGVEESQMPTGKIGDGDDGVIHSHELTKAMDFSTPFEVKSEDEIGLQSDIGDPRSQITGEITSKEEGESLKKLDASDKESDDEVHADIHEGLLSELDAVSDFSVERKDEISSNFELGQYDKVIEDSHTEIRDSTASSIKDADIGSSDPEMTVYNPKLHVLEACSIEELDSVFKQHHEEATVPPSDLIAENSLTSVTEEELSDHKPIGTDTELQVLEAKSIEDINSALKSLGETSNPQSETSEIRPERISLEPEEINSELHVIEAKSVEDISSTLQNLSEGLGETSISQSETSKIQPERTSLESPEEINSDLHVLEAKSVEDITSALKNLSEDLGESSISQSETFEIQPERTNLEPEVINSELHVLDAKSLEDIDVALKQVSEVTLEERQGHLEPEHIEVKSAEEM
ncbi:uncharacterized protein A4U43_C02F12670 [Asparagus officinalis]|uniref:Uncharacterized protein n=1 Tax=Asparagus officinalis TaxID=4686 RepID=A0A5P1FIP4_ASPOF|nr:uncharacterized protein LOC109830679 [Asparagus officinalis]ONK77954.1 uncharacterized protein A4U43_C02F12670 [Asparagus officinalis]